MANSKQVLDKIARNAQILGLTVSRQTSGAVVIDDGADDILIDYLNSDTQQPMGGVDDGGSPFLGLAAGNPGKLLFSKNAAGNDTLATVFDTEETAKAFALCAAFANNILIMDGNEGFGTAAVLTEVSGHPDLLGLGQ